MGWKEKKPVPRERMSCGRKEVSGELIMVVMIVWGSMSRMDDGEDGEEGDGLRAG